jgi:branched-chain amino acid transport system substrate-binding protein
MVKKKTYMVAVIVLALMLLTLPFLDACSAKQSDAKILKIGTGQNLFGPISMVGLIYVHGFEMAVDKINEDGGLNISGDTYMVELLVEDNVGNPDSSATAATKLVHQDGVKFLIGDVGDMNTPANYGIAYEAGDVLFAHSWLNISAPVGEKFNIPSEDVAPDKRLMIRLHPAVDEGIYKGLEYLVDNYPDVKTVGMCGLDFMFFDAFGLYHDILLPQYGLEMAGDFERFPQDCTDFYPVLTRMLAKNPDTLSLGYSGLDQYILQLKAARELGFTGPILHVPPFDESFVARITSPDLTDVFGNGIAMDNPNLPDSLKEVIQRGRDKCGEEFIADSIDAYDTMMLLTQAIEKAKSTDAQKVQDVFETLTKPGD